MEQRHRLRVTGYTFLVAHEPMAPSGSQYVVVRIPGTGDGVVVARTSSQAEAARIRDGYNLLP